jgi:hypothetical protein
MDRTVTSVFGAMLLRFGQKVGSAKVNRHSRSIYSILHSKPRVPRPGRTDFLICGSVIQHHRW